MGVLKDELTADPLGRNYGAMSDEEAAASLNAPDRMRNRTSVEGGEALEAIDVAELNALSEGQQLLVIGLLGITPLNPFGVPEKVMIEVFGVGSTTISNLRALRVESISRGVELGLGHVKVGHVQEARS